MIRITKGVEKECIFTLAEKTTIENPYYIFQLINNEDLDNIILFNPSDISLYPNRYNAFDIIVGTGGTGSVTFEAEPGMYDYNIYQSATSSLIITDCVVETGLFNIINNNETEFVTFTPDNGTQSITVTASNVYLNDDDSYTYYG